MGPIFSRAAEDRQEEAAEARQEGELHAKPWRRFEEGGGWTNEYRTKLIQDICNIELHGNLTRVKIGVFGYYASGKSSFINSVCSIDQGRLSGGAIIGSGIESVTNSLLHYIPRRQLGKFRLMDTRDFSDFCVDEAVRQILKGRRFNNTSDETPVQNNIEPVLADRCHSVVLILDATKTLPMPNDMLQAYQEFITRLRRNRVPMIIVLTRIDEVCNNISNDITNTFESSIMEKYAKHVRDVTGVPILNIYPVKNYSYEMGLDTNMDILILMAIRQIVGLADDFVKQLEDQNVDSETVHQE